MFNVIVCLTCIESLACKTVYMNEHVNAVSFPDYFLVWEQDQSDGWQNTGTNACQSIILVPSRTVSAPSSAFQACLVAPCSK